mgnify:CR=1 FL=1
MEASDALARISADDMPEVAEEFIEETGEDIDIIVKRGGNNTFYGIL